MPKSHLKQVTTKTLSTSKTLRCAQGSRVQASFMGKSKRKSTRPSTRVKSTRNFAREVKSLYTDSDTDGDSPEISTDDEQDSSDSDLDSASGDRVSPAHSPHHRRSASDLSSEHEDLDSDHEEKTTTKSKTKKKMLELSVTIVPGNGEDLDDASW